MSEPAPKTEESINVQRLRRVGTQETRPNKRKWAVRLRQGAFLLIALGVIGAIVKAWMPVPIQVELMKAERGPLLVSVDEEGLTSVKDRYIVSAPVMGTVGRIELRAGDEVKPGAVVARLVPLAPPLLDARTRAEAQARVAAAEAGRKQAYATVERAHTALQFAEREAERMRGLSSSGAAAASALERAELEARTMSQDSASAEFAARAAEHDLQMAQAALGSLSSFGGSAPALRGGAKGAERGGDQLDLTSPVQGRILRVIQQSEGVVQPGTPLLEIGDTSGLEIAVSVLTSDAVHIQPGAHVVIERWGGDRGLQAHVRRVEPSAFTQVSALGVNEQRVRVLVDLDSPPSEWARLGDNFRVEAQIAIWESKDALTVPSSAVFRRADSWAVFKVVNGIAHVTNIEVGERNPEKVEVRKGLQAGDQVVAHPSERLADGAQVQAL